MLRCQFRVPVQFLTLVAVLLFPLSAAVGQGTITGTILGTVKDASGAVVPGAAITATNQATGFSRSTQSSTTGTYTIPFLPVGTYQVKAEMSGFKTQTFTDLKLDIEQKAVINFSLGVGGRAEEMTVTGEASLVKSESMEVGEVFENERVTELPLNGRRFVQLILLTPGASPEPQGIFSQPFAVAGQSPQVNGNRSDTNNYLLDGTSLNDVTYNHIAASPSVDAIQEFKVLSGLYSSEFGSAPGAQVNVTIKSGTNDFRGAAWEFLRNEVLDAKNFFDVERQPFRQNQFGGILGGPIVKNKTFFFGNYEGLRVRKAITITSALPSDALRMGDFTGLPTIFDPLTFDPNTNTSQPFPNNQIPANRISSVSLALLDLIPPATSPGLGRNFVGSSKRIQNSDQVNARIDHTFGANDSIFERFTFSDIDNLEPIPGAASFETASAPISPPGFGQLTRVKDINNVVQYVHTFGPALINQFRFGYNYTRTRQNQENTDDFGGANGIQGTDNRVLSPGVPTFIISGFSTLGGTTFDLNWRNQTFSFIDDLSYHRGNHTLKFGFVGERVQANTEFLLAPRGQFNFLGTFTRSPQSPTTTGHPFADFLLGYPSVAAAATGSSLVHLRSYRIAAYVQDDWKVTPKLTLNLGVRYELFPPWGERDAKYANVDLDRELVVLATKDGQIHPGAMTGAFPQFTFVTAQEAGFPSRLVETDYSDFAPRIGFAYSPLDSGRFVIRAGYGIYYSRQTASNGLSFNPPFIGNKSFNNINLANPIPVETALINTSAVAPNFQYITKENPTGYVQSWSLNLQYELSRDFIAEAIYFGSKGTKLTASIFPNQATPGTTPIATRTPHPAFANSISLSGPFSWSSYNALTLRLQKRAGHGLTMAANYTYSKSLDTKSSGNSTAAESNKPQDSRNIAAEWAPSVFDITHRGTVSLVYELPFGRGKSYANQATGIAGHLVSGWSTTAVIILQGGTPFAPILAIDRSGAGVRQDRPDLVGDPNAVSDQSVDRWFNTDAFVLQPAGQFGNAGRNIIRGDGYQNVDFSVLKSTSLTERQRLEFRAEFFNLFNHPSFKLPNRVFGSADFGQIFSATDSREIQFGLKYIF